MDHNHRPCIRSARTFHDTKHREPPLVEPRSRPRFGRTPGHMDSRTGFRVSLPSVVLYRGTRGHNADNLSHPPNWIPAQHLSLLRDHPDHAFFAFFDKASM